MRIWRRSIRFSHGNKWGLESAMVTKKFNIWYYSYFSKRAIEIAQIKTF